MTSPFWEEHPEAWEQILLGAHPLPGLAQTIKVIRSQKLDVKSAPGASGATITYQGYEPAQVEITLRLWTRAQWEALQARLPELEPKAGQKPPTPFAIAHPLLALRNVQSVYIQEVRGPEETSPGMWDVTLKCLEYCSKPKSHSTHTPKTSQALGPMANQLIDPPAAPVPPHP